MDRRAVVAGLGMLAAAPQLAFAQSPSSLPAGTWSVTLYTEDAVGPLRFRFEIPGNGKGHFTSLDQPVRRRRPLDLIARISGAQIEFRIPEISASFKGRLASPDSIEGEFDYPAEGGKRKITLVRGEPSGPAPTPPAMTAGRLDQLRQDHGLPGLAVAMARRGQSKHVFVSGERRRGSHAAIAPEDLWQIASCSKSFTATMIGRLVDKGMMRWDDTVGDVLGKAAPKMLDAYRRATLLHVLSHRAGIVRSVSAWGYSFDPEKGPADRLATARNVLGQKPVAPLGAETYQYSNAGYQVAAAMAELRTGKSYEDLMRAEVFEPLELQSAMFRQSATETIRKGGQNQLQGHPPQNDGGAASNPAGGVALTLSDFLTYLASHRDETRYLKPETWRTLHTDPFGGDYALGWHVEDAENGGLIHGGALSGSMAKAWVNKARGIAGAALTNGRHRQGEALLTQCIYEMTLA